jgi:carboxyl-terminal processing protease
VLDILPAGVGSEGKHKLVTLVRKQINLAEQAAKSTIQTVTDGGVTRRVGVISLPSFYVDMEARQKGVRDYRSAARDVARLLEEMTREKVDSVLIDLRNNGGGSLAEAIELTGLFIDKGPVVQQRNARGDIAVERDTQAGVAWDGPMGVLINRNSASASEIFAAAMQDYGRGLVLGERSFGKGTVQTLISPRPDCEKRKVAIRRIENDRRAVLPHQWRHDTVARCGAGYLLPRGIGYGALR